MKGVYQKSTCIIPAEYDSFFETYFPNFRLSRLSPVLWVAHFPHPLSFKLQKPTIQSFYSKTLSREARVPVKRWLKRAINNRSGFSLSLRILNSPLVPLGLRNVLFLCFCVILCVLDATPCSFAAGLPEANQSLIFGFRARTHCFLPINARIERLPSCI